MDEKKTIEVAETVTGEVIDESGKVISKKKIGKKTLLLGAALAGLAVVTLGLSCLKKDSDDDNEDSDNYSDEDADLDSEDNIED
jgi:hypothetical protein